MRQRALLFLVPAFLLFGAALLVACGSDDDAPSSSPTAAGTASSTPAATAEMTPTSQTPEPTATTALPTATAAPQATATSAPPAATATSVPPTATTAPAPSGPVAVTIVDFGYAPASITATAGQQITLNVTNSGQLPHTFTIDGVVDSGTISGGSSQVVSFTPAQATGLQFYCTIHGAATMSGMLLVQ